MRNTLIKLGFDSRITCELVDCYYRLRLHLTFCINRSPRPLTGDRPGIADTVIPGVQVPPSLMGHSRKEICR